MTRNSNNEIKLQKEIEEKVDMLDDDSYEFGSALNKIDISIIILIACVSIVGLIIGGL
ncbi:MAG TPA: hypothetical protein VK105_00325 [Virgibacillus sp.]|nr:hypothetical protein [Virgibacillus sp.]HLR65568.1 hypothetical protein [Virgibacillus sp.]